GCKREWVISADTDPSMPTLTLRCCMLQCVLQYTRLVCFSRCLRAEALIFPLPPSLPHVRPYAGVCFLQIPELLCCENGRKLLVKSYLSNDPRRCFSSAGMCWLG
ncbi:unnamed protein product, partial [Ectocarpus fasciculatus]